MKELVDFKNYLPDVLDELFKTLDNGGDMSKFTVTIRVVDKEIELDLNGDLFESIQKIIQDEINEY